MNAIVSIGRNVGGFPMLADRWAEFQKATQRAVGEFSLQTYFTGLGGGVYLGKYEDAMTVIFRVSEHHRDALEAALAKVAKEFDQDCIAVTYGDPKFVG
jgi:hypothetical protein